MSRVWMSTVQCSVLEQHTRLLRAGLGVGAGMGLDFLVQLADSQQAGFQYDCSCAARRASHLMQISGCFTQTLLLARRPAQTSDLRYSFGSTCSAA